MYYVVRLFIDFMYSSSNIVLTGVISSIYNQDIDYENNASDSIISFSNFILCHLHNKVHGIT